MLNDQVPRHLTVTGYAFDKKESPPSKSKEERKNLKDAKSGYVDSTENFRKFIEKNFQDFKKESAEKISLIERKIVKLKEKAKTANIELGQIYQDQMDELEHTKRIHGSKLDEYKIDGESEWNAFQIEFSRDLKVFEKELADFVVNFKKK